MGDTFAISALRRKRARVAGVMLLPQEVVAKRTKELLAIDAVIRLFSPDCDPDMIPPIKPASHGLFFGYKELTRLILSTLRETGKPVTLEWIADRITAEKGFTDDKRLRKHVLDSARAGLMRMARRGLVRRILDQPDAWWELAR